MLLNKDIKIVLEYIKQNKDYLEKTDKNAYDRIISILEGASEKKYDKIISLLDGAPEKKTAKIIVNSNGAKSDFSYKVKLPTKWIKSMCSEDTAIAIILTPSGKLLIMPIAYVSSEIKNHGLNISAPTDDYIKYIKLSTVDNGKGVLSYYAYIPKAWTQQMNLSIDKKDILLTFENNNLITVEENAGNTNQCDVASYSSFQKHEMEEKSLLGKYDMFATIKANFTMNSQKKISTCRIVIPKKYNSFLTDNLETSKLFMVLDNNNRILITTIDNVDYLLNKYKEYLKDLPKEDYMDINLKPFLLNKVKSYRLTIPISWIHKMGISEGNKQLFFICNDREYIIESTMQ